MRSASRRPRWRSARRGSLRGPERPVARRRPEVIGALVLAVAIVVSGGDSGLTAAPLNPVKLFGNRETLAGAEGVPFIQYGPWIVVGVFAVGIVAGLWFRARAAARYQAVGRFVYEDA